MNLLECFNAYLLFLESLIESEENFVNLYNCTTDDTSIILNSDSKIGLAGDFIF